MTVYTFAVYLPRTGLLHQRAQMKAWREEIDGLEGLVDVEHITRRVYLIHMATKNDAIIARNRLDFVGICVSIETHQTDIYVETGFNDGEEKEENHIDPSD